MSPTDPIMLDGEGAERAAEILVRRGKAVVRKHASPGCACGVNGAGEVYVDPLCRGLFAQEEELDIVALCEIVKEQWRAENLRAEKLQAQVDMMTPLVEAARQLVQKRNEQHGNPSNPDWWQGWDWPLVVAVGDYEWKLKQQ